MRSRISPNCSNCEICRMTQTGTSTAIVQSRFADQWWERCAKECCSDFRDVHNKMADGKTKHCTRKVVSEGHSILVGATVSCRPISSKDEARLHRTGITDAPQNLHEMCITRGEMVRLLARRGLRRLGKLASLRNSPQKF